MGKLANIFDYFKDAYRINKENKVLYKPQIIFIGIKTLFFITLTILLYGVIQNLQYVWDFRELAMTILMNVGVGSVVSILAFGLLSIIMEAGVSNMYKSAVLKESAEKKFGEGVSKYFLRFLAIDCLLLLFWIVAIIPYLFIGIVTLTAGFIIIPILVTVFTTMWKVALVMEERSVFQSLKTSLKFAKENFIPLTGLIIIKNAFLQMASGTGSSSSWYMNGNNHQRYSHHIPGIENPMFSFQNALN